MPEKHLRLPAVIETTGLSRSTIYAMMNEGSFPRPVTLGKRLVAWPESTITKWLTERARVAA
ncbi:AlpA family transcriptional regulator [Shinella daejeonensis]|uniref:helix-turn-helix transcriptional regulator n=1 Tax=Shinella daejeonensis TaxID=659017 RepID=UPI0020C79E17|nr:AlpA family transcriptional regulator [Shinella daejeonensis]MCP8896365.1 AlpA family transcriptional regulator [Shinella daejeonensis]